MRILTDTIDALRKDGYFKELPEIISIQDPYNDPASVKIKVDFSLRSSRIATPSDTTRGGGPISCTCATGCKICSTNISQISIIPEGAIESVEDYTSPEINPN